MDTLEKIMSNAKNDMDLEQYTSIWAEEYFSAMMDKQEEENLIQIRREDHEVLYC